MCQRSVCVRARHGNRRQILKIGIETVEEMVQPDGNLKLVEASRRGYPLRSAEGVI